MSIYKSGNNRLSPESVLLGYLYKEALHGYEMHRRMADEFGNIWHASQSQTYSILQRLAENGQITSTQIEQAKLPPRQVLQITEAGKKQFEIWLETPTKCSVHAIRVEFITRLHFTRLYFPEKEGEMIAEQLAVVNSGIKLLESTAESITIDRSINMMALELRIRLLKSVQEWLKGCYSQFEQSSKLESN